MKLTIKFLSIASFILILSLNSNQIYAQSIDYNNGVEFSDNESYDLNSIQLEDSKPTRKVIVKKVTEEKVEITESDLAKLLERKNNLRYRNVRRTDDKCYRDSEEVCHTPNSK